MTEYVVQVRDADTGELMFGGRAHPDRPGEHVTLVRRSGEPAQLECKVSTTYPDPTERGDTR